MISGKRLVVAHPLPEFLALPSCHQPWRRVAMFREPLIDRSQRLQREDLAISRYPALIEQQTKIASEHFPLAFPQERCEIHLTLHLALFPGDSHTLFQSKNAGDLVTLEASEPWH